ncbi:MAG: phenylalanine--tRNA ligase subunit beta [Verrucomicrobia bacterium]|nr:phenylalanine--tRNA ligase subunit beta [Verrucomicrobiota bacterium]
MKVSLSWLKMHIELADLNVDKMRDLLTFAGIEVEGVEVRGIDSDKIVVAQILESKQHPNADRLSVCQVDDGSGTPRQIVCGAKNYKVGDKIPLALPGATLPGGIVIKEGKLRDVQSNGMMCSGRELGLTDDSAGLLILDAGAPVGKLFRDLQPPDVIFDLEITPNRPDLLSHFGLARELAALTGKKLNAPAELNTAAEKTATPKEIRLEAADGCPLYTARIIRGVTVAPSPEWLQVRLQSIGLRPINNIVDITNFVLHETGHPLHAFDLAKLDGAIIVRHAADSESITTLDGIVRTLDSSDLVIADSSKALAIAGVMGGSDSGVIEGTKDILLESAYFIPAGIRRTARRLGLSSDSSYRFERGVDPQNARKASALAVKLILEIAGGQADTEQLVAGEAPQLTHDVILDEDRALKLLGIPDLSREEMERVLSSLGLQKSGDAWSIPSYRMDLQRSIDLVEEVSRVIGLDRVPGRTSGAFTSSQNPDRAYDFAMSLRHALVNRGWFEAQTLRLVSVAQLHDVLGPPVSADKTVTVKNPLSEDHTTLRPGIVPGLIATAALNIRQGQARLRFFEIGRVFLTNPNGTSREEERIALLLSGPSQPISWHEKDSAPADVYDLRGTLEALTGSSLDLAPKPLDGWLLSAEVKRGSKTLGWIAQLHPARAREIDSRNPVYVAELSLSALQQGTQGAAKFTELPRFPGMTRDVALEVPADLPNAKIGEFFGGQQKKEPMLTGAEVFDVFADPTGQKLASDKKSMAWRLTYRSPERTLESKEVDEAHARILKVLLGTLPAVIR